MKYARSVLLFGHLGIFPYAVAFADAVPDLVWSIDAGDTRKPGAGYEIASSVETHPIYLAQPADGAYHHHPLLFHHDGVFYAVFSECRTGEDGPGQRVRIATSVNGKNWTKPSVVLDNIDDYSLDWKESGRMSTPVALFEVDDRVWLISDITDVVGFTNKPGSTKVVSKTRKSGLQRIRIFLGYFASEILRDGAVGEQMWVMEKAPEPVERSAFIRYPTLYEAADADFRESFLRKLASHETRVGPVERLKNTRIAQDGHRLAEHTIFQRPDRQWIQLARDTSYSHRLYFSQSSDGKSFSVPVQTGIPDSPSKTIAGSLPDGRNFIIGNFVHNPETDSIKKHYKRYPLVIALSSDGKKFDRAYAIRAEPTEPRFEVGGSSDGYQYPDVAILGDTMWVIYSENKQDIYVSKLPWKEL